MRTARSFKRAAAQRRSKIRRQSIKVEATAVLIEKASEMQRAN